MKIFMGLINITSLYEEYRAGFEALGHEVFTAETYRGPNQKDEPADLPIPDLVDMRVRQEGSDTPERRAHWKQFYLDIAWQKACEADVCFFMWRTFRDDCRDLVQLKEMGKKIIVRFCGSEVRDDHAHTQFSKSYGTSPIKLEGDALHILQKKLHYLRMCERYADLTIFTSVLGLRPHFAPGGQLMDTSGIPVKGEQCKKPIVLHAPSNRDTKGTSEVMLILDALRNAGLPFGIKMVEGLPHDQMLREYATSDIYCGSIYIGGKASEEAMAAGCVVLAPKYSVSDQDFSFIYGRQLRMLGMEDTAENQSWMQKLQGGHLNALSPIIGITPENALTELAAIIQDLPRRQRLAQAGVAYMRDNFNPVTVCARMLDMLENPDTMEHQAAQGLPWFFREQYIPHGPGPRLDLFNKYTRMVNRCPWYTRFVPRGDREGLIF